MPVFKSTTNYDIELIPVEERIVDKEIGLSISYVLRNRYNGVVEANATSYPGILSAALQAEAAIESLEKKYNEMFNSKPQVGLAEVVSLH